jgi:hypothetical protein
VNPLKLREYLSAGLPVVSTPVPEVARYTHVAANATEFIAAIERALTETGPAARAARSAKMKMETWSARVAEVTRTVDSLPRKTT